MSHIAQGVYAGATTEMVENLCADFIQETLEYTRRLAGGLSLDTDLVSVRKFAFEARGQAHSFQLALAEAILQRLENFLSALGDLSEKTIEDVRTHLDVLSDVLDGTIERDANPAIVVRSLPARPSAFDISTIEVRDVEVMLVMLHGAQTHFIEREMQACGYRVTIVTSTFTALEQAVLTKPDMVVISAVMPGLSGVDLTVALSAMPETRNTPVALITSLDPDDDALSQVPDRVPVIHKGDRFGDDLAEALSYHFLL